MVYRFAHGQAPSAAEGKGLLDTLSDRELQVLQSLGRGLGTRAIADELHISVKTVETHRAHLKEKLRISTAPALVRFAVEWARHASRN